MQSPLGKKLTYPQGNLAVFVWQHLASDSWLRTTHRALLVSEDPPCSTCPNQVPSLNIRSIDGTRCCVPASPYTPSRPPPSGQALRGISPSTPLQQSDLGWTCI